MRAGSSLRNPLVTRAFSLLSSNGRSYGRLNPSRISVMPKPGSSGMVSQPSFGSGSPSNRPSK